MSKSEKYVVFHLDMLILDGNVKDLIDEDPENYICVVKEKQYAEALELLRETTTYLNNKIAVLPCESRQRDLPEYEWEHLMFLRDKLDKFLGK